MALGSITVDLLMRTGAFSNNAKQAERRLQEMGKRARETGRVIGTALAGALTATGAAAVAMTRELVTTADQVQRLSRLSGTTTDTFQRWAAGANTVGIEQDKLADIFKDMQDRVGDFIQTGGGPMADFFERVAPRVGLTADAFARLSGPEALQLFVDSLEKAGASANEMVFYMEAIASDSTLLLPLLQNNGKAMRDLGDMAQRYGAILDKDAIAASREMKRQMDELSMIATGLRTEMAVNLLPTFQEFAELLKDDGFRSGFESIIRGALEATAAFARLAVTTANVTKFLAESAAAAVAGPSADDLVRVQDRIDRIKRTMDAIRQGGYNPVEMSGNLAGIGLPSGRALELNEDFIRGRTGSLIRKLNEELLKEENKLQFGMELAEDQVAEAARLAQEAADKIQTPTIGLGIGPAPAAAGKGSRDSGKSFADQLAEFDRAMMENEARQLEWMTRIEDATALMEGPASVAVLTLKRSIAEADAALAAGTITIAQHSDYVAAMGHQYGEAVSVMDTATGEMSAIADQAARNIQDAFADFLFDPFQDGLSGMVESFAETLRRLAAQAAASKIFEAIGTWAGSYSGAGSGWVNAIGGILDGRRASGGPAYAGGTFLVGENGPELLHMGGNSGTVIPNNRLPGLGSGGPSMKVEIINQGAPMQVERQEIGTGPNGEKILRLLIKNEVNRGIAQGDFNQSMRSAFGLQRQGYANG